MDKIIAANALNVFLAERIIDDSSDMFETFAIKYVTFCESVLSFAVERVVLIKDFSGPKIELGDTIVDDYDLSGYIQCVADHTTSGTPPYRGLVDDLKTTLNLIQSQLVEAETAIRDIRAVKTTLHDIFPRILLPETGETSTHYRCTRIDTRPIHPVFQKFGILGKEVLDSDGQRMLRMIADAYKVGPQIPCWPDTKRMLSLGVNPQKPMGPIWTYRLCGSIPGSFTIKWNAHNNSGYFLIGLSDKSTSFEDGVGYFFSPMHGWIIDGINAPTALGNYAIQNSGTIEFTLDKDTINVHSNGRLLCVFKNCKNADHLYPTVTWNYTQLGRVTFV